MAPQQQLPGDSVVRDVITDVFTAKEYSRSWQDLLWSTFWDIVRRVQTFIGRMASENPAMFWVSVTLLVLALVLLFARGAYLAKMRSELIARMAASRGAGGLLEQDAWRAAQTLAKQGRYTEAAHALYRHLLNWLSQHERVELHPSKTIGDYGRALRARSSQVHGKYREFGRTYEVVVYGHGECDRDRYERLLSMATAITGGSGNG